MAINFDTIRATADRVAASHGLEVVDIEYSGGGKHRSLRVFLEKTAEARATLPQTLPKQVLPSMLSGITHEDCAEFARDFGTLLDIDDLVPGTEYTLEVSSPGLERKLRNAADYERFRGSLAKIQTFTPVENNRHFTGRMIAFDGQTVTLDLSAVKQKGKARKAATSHAVNIPLANIEKANLVPEF